MALQRADELPGTDIPKLDRPVHGACCEQCLTVTRERQVVDMFFGDSQVGTRAAAQINYSYQPGFTDCVGKLAPVARDVEHRPRSVVSQSGCGVAQRNSSAW